MCFSLFSQLYLHGTLLMGYSRQCFSTMYLLYVYVHIYIHMYIYIYGVLSMFMFLYLKFNIACFLLTL